VVSLETSGALSVAEVDVRVIKILDIKTPGSAEVQRNNWQNLQHLQAHDEIKFVICDRADYRWAKARIAEHGLSAWQLWMSPSHQQLQAEQLAGWILQDRLSVRLQLQLHKYIWGDQPGR
jgi:7-carboxy-7-deazaguanine synthase